MSGWQTPSDNSLVQEMIRMGFSRSQAEEALKATNNNVDRAVDWIFSKASPVVPMDVVGPSPQPSSGSGTKSNPIPVSDSNNQQMILHPTAAQPTKTKEEEDIARAIALSLAEGANGGSTSGSGNKSSLTGLSKEEEEMSRALEQSLMASNGRTEEDAKPPEMVRQDGVPVGLKNVGNTCYLNSLLQMYYHIADFRKMVLQCDTELPVMETPEATVVTSSAAPTAGAENVPRAGAAEKQAAAVVNNRSEELKKFMSELQTTFARLMLSKKKYVDPSGVVRHILARDGAPFKMGNQEDVSEFNDMFLQQVEEILKATNPEAASTIKEMFYGHAVERVNAKEADGAPVSVSNKSEFNHIILNVGEDLKDIFDSLDAYTSAEAVDYTTELGHATRAEKQTWFADLPRVLMLQLQRLAFDPISKTAKKINVPMKFPTELAMDRYLEANAAETLRKRAIVKILSDQIATAQSELKAFTNYKDRSLSIDTAIDAMLDLFSSFLTLNNSQKSENGMQENGNATSTAGLLMDLVQGEDFVVKSLQSGDTPLACEGDDNRAEKAVQILNAMRKDVTKRMEELRARISELESQRSAVFSDMPTDHKYQLHAVLVHEGSPEFGHYWAHIRNPAKTEGNTWTKFNDRNVASVEEASAMKDGEGGNGRIASAYYLIYVDTARCSVAEHSDQPYDDMLVPLQVKVAEDNEKFDEELRQWEEKNKVKPNAAGPATAAGELPALVSPDDPPMIPSCAAFGHLLSPTSTQTSTIQKIGNEMWEHQLFDRYQNMVQKSKEIVGEDDSRDDPRLDSFGTFLGSIGQSELAKIALFEENYNFCRSEPLINEFDTTDRGRRALSLLRNLASEQHHNVAEITIASPSTPSSTLFDRDDRDHSDRDQPSLARRMALLESILGSLGGQSEFRVEEVHERMEQMKAEWEKFKRAAGLFAVGLNYLLGRQFFDALGSLMQSYKIDSSLSHPSLSRQKSIAKYLRICIKIFFQETMDQLRNSQWPAQLSLRAIASACKEIISSDPSDPLLADILSQLTETRPTLMTQIRTENEDQPNEPLENSINTTLDWFFDLQKAPAFASTFSEADVPAVATPELIRQRKAEVDRVAEFASVLKQVCKEEEPAGAQYSVWNGNDVDSDMNAVD